MFNGKKLFTHRSLFGRKDIGMSKNKIIIDDGFNPEFVETALFDGVLEMPCLTKPDTIVIPEAMIPFSVRNRTLDHKEFVVFYEYDTCFGDILRTPQKYLKELAKFPGMVSLDNSVYVDSPLIVQLANVYRSRAIGHYYQSKGLYVIPNVRWGDERSYTTCALPEKFAFLGLPKHSILSIGTYGASKTAEEKYHLRHGLIAMLEELLPEVVLVYGAMPEAVFKGLYDKTHFIHFQDWTSSKKRRNV